MQAAAFIQGSLVWKPLTCLQNVRRIPSRNATHVSRSLSTKPFCLTSTSLYRQSRTVCAAQEEFAEVEAQVDFEVPSVLELTAESRVASAQDTSNASNVEDISDGLGLAPPTGTVRQVFQAAKKAVGDAPVESVGQFSLYGGVVGFCLLVSGAILNSVDNVPVVPEALQTVGLLYSVLMASQLLQKKSVTFPPPSPFKAVVELVDGGQAKAKTISLNLQGDLSKAVATVVEKLSNERDTTLSQAEVLRKAADKIASVIAEKEALEAVSLQLADERDVAMSEVSALKDAISGMTNRIKGIEEMLERELSELKQQNQALETVSLQLAAERDSAMQEIEKLRILVVADSSVKAEKEALETIAIQLAQERDSARAEVEELTKVVSILREATSTASGLTPEQEVFIKARVREIRSQFIDVGRTYEEQKDEVDRFIGHLVQEYGAPQDWTEGYIKQFLNSSATKLSPPAYSSGLSQVESLKTQTSRNS